MENIKEALHHFNMNGQYEHSDFTKELSSLINRHSMEQNSNTPDYILANYLTNCLYAFNECSKHREAWYGKSLSII